MNTRIEKSKNVEFVSKDLRVMKGGENEKWVFTKLWRSGKKVLHFTLLFFTTMCHNSCNSYM